MKHAHETGLWQKTSSHGKRWKRPPQSLYESIRCENGSIDVSQWRPEVVAAIRTGLGWADQTTEDLPGEAWKPVHDRWGLATQVEVSTSGRVRRHDSGRLLLQSLSTHGYPIVRLNRGRGKNAVCIKTHVLIAEALLGPRPSTKHVVNHKDLNKQNNDVRNLEWTTYAENSAHWARSKGLTN